MDRARGVLAQRIVLLALVACGCIGEAPMVAEPASITLSQLPTGTSIAQGESGSVTASVVGSEPGIASVALAVNGAPAGVAVTVSNLVTTGTVSTATITFEVGPFVAPGTYTLEVQGSGAGVTPVAMMFTLNVLPVAVACPDTGNPCAQWAESATASSEYTSTDWGAIQATGPSNVPGCEDNAQAWGSLHPTGVDWLELRYRVSVIPTEIRVFETYAVGSLVKVEVIDEAGLAHVVHEAAPGPAPCPRMLRIPVTGIPFPIRDVRLSFDQSQIRDWNEVDAVMLIGNR